MRLPFYSFLLTILSLWCVCVSAYGAGPWHWVMSLKGEPSGLPMHVPTSVYVDPQRARYYVVDSGHNRLLSFDRDGNFLKAFDAMGKLSTPYDMIREQAGVLWVVERGRNSITRIELKQRKITPNIIRTSQGEPIYPDRIIERDGLFYVLDKANGDVLVLNRDLVVESHFACEGCCCGFSDFKLKGNELWALDQIGRVIYRFSIEDGRIKQKTAIGQHVDFPASIAVDKTGNIFVLDRHRGCVAVFDHHGGLRYRFLRSGEAQGRLHLPSQIRFDPWGRLLIVDEGNGRVEVFAR